MWLGGDDSSKPKEIPDLLKKKRMLHDTIPVHSTGDTTAAITFYQCKQSKSVNILSTLHKDVVIPEHNNPKRKPQSVLFYNQTKVGVDVLDQMFRLYLVKAASRKWPVHIFYNVIDMALINSWVIYKAVCKSNISRRPYIQKVCEDFTGSLNGATESMSFGRLTRFNTASSTTRRLKKKSVITWDSLLQKTAARVLVNRAEME